MAAFGARMMPERTSTAPPPVPQYYREPEPSPGWFPTHLVEPLVRSFGCALRGGPLGARLPASAPAWRGDVGPQAAHRACSCCAAVPYVVYCACSCCVPPCFAAAAAPAANSAAPAAAPGAAHRAPPLPAPPGSKDHYVEDEGDIVFYKKDDKLKIL